MISLNVILLLLGNKLLFASIFFHLLPFKSEALRQGQLLLQLAKSTAAPWKWETIFFYLTEIKDSLFSVLSLPFQPCKETLIALTTNPSQQLPRGGELGGEISWQSNNHWAKSEACGIYGDLGVLKWNTISIIMFSTVYNPLILGVTVK